MAAVKFTLPAKPVARIETPATVTRRPYRVRQHGQTVHFGVESGAHYADRNQIRVAVVDLDETGRETENRRFVRAATQAWGAVILSGVK